MAPKKQGPETPKKSNKIRLVVFEADLSDGNLTEITQAITMALKPTVQPIYRQLPNGRPPAQLLPPSDDADAQDESEEDAAIEAADEQEAPAAQVPAKPQRPRTKPKQPELVDLDWTGTGGPTFKEFAAEKAPKSRARKYLVAACWLKEFGGYPTVNANQVYSAFRAAGWSVAFADWHQPFRNLVHSDHMRKGTNSGEYSITTVGEGVLEKAEE